MKPKTSKYLGLNGFFLPQSLLCNAIDNVMENIRSKSFLIIYYYSHLLIIMHCGLPSSGSCSHTNHLFNLQQCECLQFTSAPLKDFNGDTENTALYAYKLQEVMLSNYFSDIEVQESSHLHISWFV